MSEIENGGPAFPVSPKKVEAGLVYMACDGLSKREWFAGMALMGILARSFGDSPIKDLVCVSYEYADAMLRAGKGEK